MTDFIEESNELALIKIKPGDYADANLLNENFNTLGSKIALTRSDMATLENNVNDNINTTLQSFQELEETVNASNTKIENLVENLTENYNTLNSNVTNINTSITNISTNVTKLIDEQTAINLEDSGTIELTDNSVNIITPTDEVTFVLPEITDLTKYHQILVLVKLDSTDFISADDDRLGITHFIGDEAPVFISTGYYDIIYEYNPLIQSWVCGVIEI